MGKVEQFLGEKFLIKKFPELKKSGAVKREVERQKRDGNPPVKDPAERITNWLNRLEGTKGHRDNPEKLKSLKDFYYSEYVIKPENIPDSYFENQRRIAREEGRGDIEITPQIKQELTETIIKDQKASLDTWINYFVSPDADAYPIWSKYWSFRSMLRLSNYDKEKKAFSTRSKDTVSPFPDLNREALAYVVDVIDERINNKYTAYVPIKDNAPKLQELLSKEDFGKLYAYAIENITPAETNELFITEGKWVKYPKGSDHIPLVNSLQGKGTGWCTAGESTAEIQLKGGDFYVYYSKDRSGKPAIPRAAIRMEEDKIAEVRGIAFEQNLDPYIQDVVEKKLDGFPDKEKYKKKTADMKLLTQIDNKQKKGEGLTKDELEFLYELYARIEGFGYQEDPRIKEIKGERNKRQDYALIFNCKPDQVALSEKELNQKTTVFDGSFNYRFGSKELYPSLTSVVGYVYLRYNQVKELPANLTYIKDSLDLRNTQIEKLPANIIYIGGNLWVNDSQLNEFPGSLIYIGGDLQVNGKVNKLPTNINNIVKGEIFRDKYNENYNIFE